MKNAEWRMQNGDFILHSAFSILHFLVVAWHRFDGEDHFFVGHFVRAAGKAGIAPIHEDRTIALGVASESSNQLTTLRVVKGTKIHGSSPSQIEPYGSTK